MTTGQGSFAHPSYTYDVVHTSTPTTVYSWCAKPSDPPVGERPTLAVRRDACCPSICPSQTQQNTSKRHEGRRRARKICTGRRACRSASSARSHSNLRGGAEGEKRQEEEEARLNTNTQARDTRTERTRPHRWSVCPRTCPRRRASCTARYLAARPLPIRVDGVMPPTLGVHANLSSMYRYPSHTNSGACRRGEIVPTTKVHRSATSVPGCTRLRIRPVRRRRRQLIVVDVTNRCSRSARTLSEAARS